MAPNPNKLSQFWQELKRRKVVRTITVYAAAAFVILELLSIIIEPLRLPDWTLQFAIVFLCIGFIVAVILSWIYDIHPKGGMVKTGPVEKVKEEDIPKSSNGWKIASYISFVVIIALIVFNVLPRNKVSKKSLLLDKSIAVLPFRNDSEDKGNEHFINGAMESILDNLCKIEDLRVPGRTSVEQYRGVSRPIPEIAAEMNVSYILEGSGQKLGDRILLSVQLLNGKNDQHLWSKQYDRKIHKIEDLIDIQSEIAKLVASEIEAIVTPKEKVLIEKILTTNLTAYDFYQRGREEHWKFKTDNDNREALERAKELYQNALEYDSTFALAYTGLARVYWDRHYWDTYFTENFLDSVLILADKAISYDNQIAEAYTIKGDSYREIGQEEQAIREYSKAITLNPNDWEAYLGKGEYYAHFDGVKGLENYHKAVSLNRGSELPALLHELAETYHRYGFKEKAFYYSQEALKLDNDSFLYYYGLGADAGVTGDFANGIKFGKAAYALDSSNVAILLSLGDLYMWSDQYKESLKYYKKFIARLNSLGILQTNYMHRVAYAFWMNGLEEEAEHYFNLEVEYCNMNIELGRIEAQQLWSYYDLASVYAFRGEKEKAYENLRIYNQRPTVSSWMMNLHRRDPLFESMRDEPEYQQIIRDAESKYQAEHARINKWLDENDML